MRLRQVEKALDHPDYIFELKRGGFRAIGYLQNGECKILSLASGRILQHLPSHHTGSSVFLTVQSCA